MAKGARTARGKSAGRKDKGESKPIKYVIPPDVPIMYADQAVVQHYLDEFVISFFQSAHPLIFGKADFQSVTDVQTTCIARFVLNPRQMARLTEAMAENFNNWQKQQQAFLAKAQESKK